MTAWRETIRSTPAVAGLYCVLSGDRLLYIGQSQNIARRLDSHHLRATFIVNGATSIRWITVEDRTARLASELFLIRLRRPPLNGDLRKRGMRKSIPPDTGRIRFAPHELGGEIARIRQQAGMTQGEFAKKYGTSRQAIWSWESGKFAPSEQMLHTLGFYVDYVPK